MTTVTVKLPEELDHLLEAKAEKMKVSKSDVIRQYLDMGLRGSKMEEEVSCYTLAQDLCGSIEKLPKDLSTNKKHLDGFGK